MHRQMHRLVGLVGLLVHVMPFIAASTRDRRVAAGPQEAVLNGTSPPTQRTSRHIAGLVYTKLKRAILIKQLVDAYSSSPT